MQTTSASSPALPITERTRMIMQTLLQMDKQFGKGAVLQLGSRSAQQVSVISTGSISFDSALGVGGRIPSLSRRRPHPSGVFERLRD